jgi:hypothetical protein
MKQVNGGATVLQYTRLAIPEDRGDIFLHDVG